MLNWLKWKLAPKEMAELERWSVQWEEHRRWFAEFPEVALVLDTFKYRVEDRPCPYIHVTRDELREAKAITQEAQS